MNAAIKYPVGGERQPVYDLLKSLGFVMGPFNDKHWNRRDGYEAHVFGAGSRAHVRFGDDTFECALDDLESELAKRAA